MSERLYRSCNETTMAPQQGNRRSSAMSSSAGSVAAYVEAARKLAPQIREARRDIEQGRNLPAALAEAMTEAGFVQLWRCCALGGPELDFTGFLQVIEELSRADGSVGWCAMVATVWTRLSGTIAESAGREIFADGSRLAGSVNPTGKAVAVPGGFRVSGRWATAALSRTATGQSATRSC